MSNQIRIDVRCEEHYELDVYCNLPYGFTEDDISDVHSNGWGYILVYLTNESSKEFIKIARRDSNIPQKWEWEKRGVVSTITFKAPLSWDFENITIEEYPNAAADDMPEKELIVSLETTHDQMECYDVEHYVNHWEDWNEYTSMFGEDA